MKGSARRGALVVLMQGPLDRCVVLAYRFGSRRLWDRRYRCIGVRGEELCDRSDTFPDLAAECATVR